MKDKHAWLIFSTLYTLFVITSAASLTQLSVQSDTLIIGLASILAAYTIAMLLISRLHLMRKFKFGPGGVEAVFRDMEEKALEVGEAESSPEVKEEIRDIQRSDTHPYGVFLVLMGEIEQKLRLIAESRDYSGFKYTPTSRLVTDLEQKGMITEKLGHLIRQFWQVRTMVVHGVGRIDRQGLQKAISIGEVVMAQLDRVYKEIAQGKKR